MGRQIAAADSLTLHLAPQFDEDLADGDGVHDWMSISGEGAVFSQSDPDHQPQRYSAIRWNAPAYRFGGGGPTPPVHYLDGPDMDTIVDSSHFTIMIAFYVSSLNDDQVYITDKTGTNGRLKITVLTTGAVQAFAATGAGNKTVSILTSDRFPLNFPGWNIATMELSGGSLWIYLNDPLEGKSVACGSLLALSGARLGASANADLGVISGYIGQVVASNLGWNEQNRSFVYANLANAWMDRGDPLAQMRHIASNGRLVAFEKPRRKYSIGVGLRFLESAQVFSRVRMSNKLLIGADGQGAGILPGEQAILRVQDVVMDIDNYKLNVKLHDLTDLLHVYRESCVGTRTSDPRQEGNFKSGTGVYRFPAAGMTSAWLESPSDGTVVEVKAGVEAVERAGVVDEPASNQLLLRSSFISGTTGLTPHGVGTNGSAISVETAAPLLFDSAVTTKYLKFLAGTPHTADLQEQWPKTIVEAPLAAGAMATVSVDRRGAQSNWWFQRDTDNKWWRESDLSWQGTAQVNVIPASSDPNVIERWRSEVIRWGASSGRGTFYFGLASGGTSGRETMIYHAQIEALPYCSSRIPQDASFIGPRSSRSVGFAEDTTRGIRWFNYDRGTLYFWLTTPWSAEDLQLGTSSIPGGIIAVLFNYMAINPPSDYYWQARFNGSLGLGASRWEFAVKNGGAEMIAYQDDPSTLPARFSQRFFAVRWTSEADGELDLPANTLSIFVGDGVSPAIKGVDVQLSSRPFQQSASRIEMSLNGGRMKRLFSMSRVFSDDWIKARSIT